MQSNQNNKMAKENFKIISSKKNPFLEREELIIELTGDVPPSNVEVKEIAGKDPNTVVVNTIKTSFGTQTYVADVFVYDSVESKEKIQTIPQKVRKKLAEEVAAAKKAGEEAAKKEAEEKAAAEEAAKAESEKPEEEKTEESPAEEPEAEKIEESVAEENKPEEVKE